MGAVGIPDWLTDQLVCRPLNANVRTTLKARENVTCSLVPESAVTDASDNPETLQQADTLPQEVCADDGATDINDVCGRALQEQWACAQRQAILSAEEVLQKYPVLSDHPNMLVDVIYNEFLIANEHKSLGDTDPETYIRRFPELETQLTSQFQLHSCLSSGFGDDGEATTDSAECRTLADLAGTVLHARYELIELVGTGSIGNVYRAVDRQLGRDVAVKISRTPFADESQPYRRFLREAEAVAQLSHPGIVQVFEFGNSAGCPFIVGQFVSGGTLAGLTSTTPTTLAEFHHLCDTLIQICEAAHYAHQCGIVHRDLKPANILYNEQGRPLIADFGLATLPEADSTLTAHGDVLGTPAYMSPEQAGASDVGTLSDVYSLGVILYQLLTGQLPFNGNTVALLYQIQHDEAVPPGRHNSAVPADLQTICMKAMSRSAADRYSTARAMADDLQRFRHDEPIHARPIGAAEKLSRLVRRHPAVSVMTLLLLLVSGITFGGGLQYLNVVSQRDRANEAEAQTLELLARDTAIAGRLAQQQGYTRTAIERYEEALERGFKNAGDLHFRIAECHLVHGDVVSAVRHLQRAVQSGTKDVPGTNVDLLKARLALLGVTEFGKSHSLLNSLNSDELDDADQYFLAGINAESSPEALAAFQKSLQLNSHHHASRSMACLLALSLANFDLAMEVATVSQQLFPDDSDFILMEALARAGLGERAESVALIQRTHPTDRERAEWTAFVDFLLEVRTEHSTGGERVFHSDAGGDKHELSFDGLLALMDEFQSSYLKLIRQRNWHLPPRIEDRFVVFVQSAAALTESEQWTAFLDGGSRSRKLMQSGLAIIEAHPEGTLSTVIARQLLDLGVANNDDRKKIQFFFESAISADSFASDVRDHAMLGAYAVAVNLLHLYKVEPEKNLKRVLELTDEISPDVVTEVETARVMTLIPQTYNRWDYAERCVPRWIELARAEGSTDSLVSALWELAVIQEHNEDWMGVLETCDEIIRISPDPQRRDHVIAPEGLMSRAASEITGELTRREYLSWERIFEAALRHDKPETAQLVLRVLEQDTTVNRAELQRLRAQLQDSSNDRSADTAPGGEDNRAGGK